MTSPCLCKVCLSLRLHLCRAAHVQHISKVLYVVIQNPERKYLSSGICVVCQFTFDKKKKKMENNFTNVTFQVSEKQNGRILEYANSKGVSVQEAVNQLVNIALSAGDLNNGKVNGFSRSAQDQLSTVVLDTLTQYQESVNSVSAKVPSFVLGDDETVFKTAPEIKDIINQINITRSRKGLGPLEHSIAELIFHWSENLADHSSFKACTGIEYDNFKDIIRTVALKERDANGCTSNLIERKGSIFSISTYSIVDTAEAIQ